MPYSERLSSAADENKYRELQLDTAHPHTHTHKPHTERGGRERDLETNRRKGAFHQSSGTPKEEKVEVV